MGAGSILSVINPVSVATNLIDKLVPDKNAKQAAQIELLKMQESGELQQVMGQIAINQAEAASGKWFEAGWRPAVGWVCALGLFSQFLVRPFVISFCRRDWPSLDMPTLGTILFAMLGIGAHQLMTSNGIDLSDVATFMAAKKDTSR